MKKKKSSYSKPKIISSKIKNIQFYSRSSYPNNPNAEYELVAALPSAI